MTFWRMDIISGNAFAKAKVLIQKFKSGAIATSINTQCHFEKRANERLENILRTRKSQKQNCKI